MLQCGLALPLSPQESQALNQLYWLPPRFEKKIDAARNGPPRFARHEFGLIVQAVSDRLDWDGADRVTLAVLRDRVVELLEADNPEAFGGEYLRDVDWPAAAAELYFQFRIELLYTNPPSWRRIKIADGPLSTLHDAIQGSFEWAGCHLHEFMIRGVRYASTPPPEFADCALEGIAEEEVNIPGFEYILELLEGHKTTQRDDELLEWLGPFDPAAFEAEKATQRMRTFAGLR